MKGKSNCILVVDIETTGFRPSNDCVLEIGIVELNLTTGEVRVLLDTLLREEEFGEDHHDSWVFDNSTLQPSDIYGAPDASGVYEKVQDIIDEYPLGVTAYNKAFDFRFLRARGVVILNEIDCPMLAATDICELPNPNRYGGYKWPKVEEAWGHFFPDTPYVEAHRGADDAKHEAKIVHEMYRQGIIDVI